MSKRSSQSDNEMRKPLREAFQRLSTEDCRYWVPYLFQVVKDSEQICFDARQITIEQDEWKKYLEGIEKDYVGGRKPFLGEGFSFREYDGSAPDEGMALHAKCADEAVGLTVMSFLKSIDCADAEHGGRDLNENGLAICGQSDEGLRTIFVSGHSPFMAIKNRFWLLHGKTEYTLMKEKLLVLPKKMDAVVVGDDIWFLTLQGAQLFAPESICRKIAQDRVESMKGLSWIEGFSTLESEAVKGFNPRRFLAFNGDKVADLAIQAKRKDIARKFHIDLTKAEKINLTNPISANNFIKVICDKAMVDPFNDDPMEVSGAKEWKVR